VALPVVVAGAGPVGLTLACELDRLGVPWRLADAAAGRAVVSRATDLHAGSLEAWDRIGAADAILAAGLPIAGVPLLSDGREIARLDFAGVDSRFPAAVSLAQHDLEAILDALLRRPVEWGRPVEIAWQEDDAWWRGSATSRCAPRSWSLATACTAVCARRSAFPSRAANTPAARP
jgi:2-polyprenyl-6-methoxyphenol hydroxylase-like FAD-dependent oxidoreductase